MTSPLSGRPEPEAPESAIDARRRLADAQATSASQAAAGAAAVAQAQHDVAVSLRSAGPMAVGTINGAGIAAAPISSEVLTFSDVVPVDYWDGPHRDLIVQLHRAALAHDAEQLGVAPQWHTVQGPWAVEQRWMTTGVAHDGQAMTGTVLRPPGRTDGQPDDSHSHYLVTTTVHVVRP